MILSYSVIQFMLVLFSSLIWLSLYPQKLHQSIYILTCCSPRYLNAIQTNAHHLLRYLATAVVVNKRRRNMLKELIKVIQQEQHSYKDPITEFLECLYVNYDFDGAQQKLMECEQVTSRMFFSIFIARNFWT